MDKFWTPICNGKVKGFMCSLSPSFILNSMFSHISLLLCYHLWYPSFNGVSVSNSVKNCERSFFNGKSLCDIRKVCLV